MRVLIFFGMLFLFEAFKLFLGKNGFRIGGFLPTFVFIGAELYQISSRRMYPGKWK